MKKLSFLFAAIAMVATPAAVQASEINLAGVGTSSVNVRSGATEQAAIAGDVSFGNVSNSDIANTATALVNTAVNTVDVTQTANLGNGALVATGNLNLSEGPVSQLAIAASGTEAVSNASSIANSALASTNLSSTAVTVTQK